MRAMGESKMQIYLGTDDDISDKTNMELAVDKELIAEDSLNKGFSDEEADNVLDKFDELYYGEFWPDDVENVEYNDNVKQLEYFDIKDYKEDDNTIQLDPEAAKNLKKGDMIIFDYKGLKVSEKISEDAGNGAFSLENPEIEDVFDTLIVRDIRKKYKIRNTQLMDRIVDFLMDNVSNLSSARNITNTLGSMQEKIHHTTVGNYMQYLCNAFAFYKVRRYDIKGKKYLSSNDKYYLSDHTFRYAKLGTKNMDYGRILENIVAIELLRRGYEVYVGILYKKEIDFVAVKRSEKIYIQVSDNISEEKTFEREVAPLLQIKDAYPKYVIARTRHDEYQYEGIKVIDIADWLLDK